MKAFLYSVTALCPLCQGGAFPGNPWQRRALRSISSIRPSVLQLFRKTLVYRSHHSTLVSPCNTPSQALREKVNAPPSFSPPILTPLHRVPPALPSNSAHCLHCDSSTAFWKAASLSAMPPVFFLGGGPPFAAAFPAQPSSRHQRSASALSNACRSVSAVRVS